MSRPNYALNFLDKVTLVVVATAGIFYIAKLAASMVEDQKMSKSAKKQLAEKLKRRDIEGMEFTQHEGAIAADIQSADEITTKLSDVGGLDDILKDVKDNVLLPLKVWHRIKHQNKPVPIPSGILLYGKPGTGKVWNISYPLPPLSHPPLIHSIR
jgi:ATP-dependent 26S proteasome regulatory subunit